MCGASAQKKAVTLPAKLCARARQPHQVFDVDVALVVIAFGAPRAVDTLALAIRLLVHQLVRPLMADFQSEMVREVRAFRAGAQAS
jgi:hypothetical protein